jgi:hypothetical protein
LQKYAVHDADGHGICNPGDHIGVRAF